MRAGLIGRTAESSFASVRAADVLLDDLTGVAPAPVVITSRARRVEPLRNLGMAYSAAGSFGGAVVIVGHAHVPG